MCMATAPAEAGKLTIVYGPAGDAQTLDLYRPDSAAPAKLIVFVHGGGWTKGNKGGGRRIALPLVQAGYAVASINYRLLDPSSGIPRLEDAVADVAAATQFLLAHASQYHLDPARFALAGHSAGGHLVALVATDPSYAHAAGLDLTHLAALITLDGAFDIRQPHNRNPVITTDPTYRWHMSPTAHVAEITGHPLFCIIHEDTAARFGVDADSFTAALKAHGDRVVESVVPGLTHGEMVGHFNDPAAPLAGDVEQCLNQALKP